METTPMARGINVVHRQGSEPIQGTVKFVGKPKDAVALVRGADQEWIKQVYEFALKPDVIIYLRLGIQDLITRVIQTSGFNYWESGMDMDRSGNMYDSFISYQKDIQRQFRNMQKVYGFETVNGNRSPRAIQKELQSKIESILHGNPPAVVERSVETAPHDRIFVSRR